MQTLETDTAQEKTLKKNNNFIIKILREGRENTTERTGEQKELSETKRNTWNKNPNRKAGRKAEEAGKDSKNKETKIENRKEKKKSDD